MYTNSKLAKSIRLALAVGAVSTAFAGSALAQEDTQEIEKIEVTGSSIKRTDMEGSLPVDVISKEDIARTGVTSVPDLIAQLPSMQGFVAAGESVGGGGGGTQTASLRDLGSDYTLVLLNGRRMASSDSGGRVDLSSIPLSAIERVEILKDGASALYGSDAIAGVVNFILKKDVDQTTISARFDKPQETGGESNSFSISTGFGDLGKDGFNVMIAYSRDEQEQLRSVDRDFAKTGFLPFSFNDQDLVSISGSSNAIPGNAYITFNDEYAAIHKAATGSSGLSFNPYRLQNNGCHDTSAPSTSSDTCVFDYTSTLEIEPESVRDNIFVQGVAEISDDAEAYATYSWSNFDLTSRIAPYPTGLFVLPLDSQVVQDNVMPFLTAEQAANITRVSARWRTLPGGNRTTEWGTETSHFVAGIRGDWDDISYDVAITNGESTRDEFRVTGYPIETPFIDLVSSGAVNVFADPSTLSDDQRQMVQDTMFTGLWESTDTSMRAIEAKASAPVFELPEGDVYLGVGFDYREVEYSRVIGQGNRDEVVLFESATPEYDLSRETYGMYAEMVAPLFENFELTAAVRYDNIGSITDTKRAAGQQTVNPEQDDTTYKISAVYRPTDEWLIRASYGTGFKAPSMRQIAEPRIEFGVTSVAYDCPFPSSDPMSELCYDDKLQYDVYREGYSGLRPETSEQMTAGIIYNPSNDFNFGLEYWNIEMEDQVTRLTQDQIFNNPDLYRDLFTSRVDPGTGDNVLAVIQAAVNIGKATATGLDWNIDLNNETVLGDLRTSVQGTYMIESESLRSGTTDVWDSSVGRVGTDLEVTFRNIITISNTLTSGDFAHTLNVKYRSGYRDVVATGVVHADDWSKDGGTVQLYIPSYTLVDYRTAYNFNEELTVSFGINNLFDKQPPLTLNGAAGHQVGYDPRYSDAYGRTFYISADYTF